ncbi:sigma-70 family RNA polymerase sigma factor [Algimonas porphyrae]|uniref:RNA polymerase sigma factor n=1 Tax=Algimonas porphyrae TaxID=1128113 RepID=A0ABQ5V0V5_9PROT|nr:sigma-70 family RNA polymerase sigma factor [Algimonas porphyrae]GLQ21058.1 RNA polymerase sigma factor [Algimonas porphyrae]
MHEPDKDLIPGLRAGDEAALRALIDRRMASVHRVAYRLLGDRFEAEDVCQDTFLKFWRAAPNWRDGEARILTWLCRVATNGCYDRLRKKRPDLPGDMLEPVDSRAPVDRKMVADERWDALQTAMMTLPERQRTALSLCYDEAMPQRDAAAVMGLGQKAYEALLVRARRALRALMEETEHA